MAHSVGGSAGSARVVLFGLDLWLGRRGCLEHSNRGRSGAGRRDDLALPGGLKTASGPGRDVRISEKNTIKDFIAGEDPGKA